MRKSGTLFFSVGLVLLIMLTGCFQGEQTLEEIDAPQDRDAVKGSKEATNNDAEEKDMESEQEKNDGEAVAETVARQLFLLDVNGMIASQTVELPTPESKEVATQVLEYLVKGGPVTPILPNGFQAVLPEGTEIIGMDLQEDGTLVVDLSKEFENYPAEDELKILQSMTYTLTQFENVNRIELWINGHPLNEMPVNGTPISTGYSRTNGINIISSDTTDFINSQAVTMYYPAEYNENRYYVPVTQHVESDKGDMLSSIVQALIDGPRYNNLNVTHVFNSNTVLAEAPTLKNGVLELIFNEQILKDIEQAIIADEVMETLVRTLTEQHNVEAVHVKVKDVDKLNNENGETYDEPVTKKYFMEVEKL